MCLKNVSSMHAVSVYICTCICIYRSETILSAESEVCIFLNCRWEYIQQRSRYKKKENGEEKKEREIETEKIQKGVRSSGLETMEQAKREVKE